MATSNPSLNAFSNASSSSRRSKRVARDMRLHFTNAALETDSPSRARVTHASYACLAVTPSPLARASSPLRSSIDESPASVLASVLAHFFAPSPSPSLSRLPMRPRGSRSEPFELRARLLERPIARRRRRHQPRAKLRLQSSREGARERIHSNAERRVARILSRRRPRARRRRRRRARGRRTRVSRHAPRARVVADRRARREVTRRPECQRRDRNGRERCPASVRGGRPKTPTKARARRKNAPAPIDRAR